MKIFYKERAYFLCTFLLLLLVDVQGFANNRISDGAKNNTNAAPLAGPFYPSTAGGNWNSGVAWSISGCNTTGGLSWPTTSSDNVNMTCAKTITVSSTSTGGALTINGGTLIINSGSTLNVTSLTMTTGTLTVNGTLNITQGGTGAFSITGGTFTQNATGSVSLSSGAQDI
ncbi:MAG TPA: hypothetical protein VFQ50_03475, partial [Flavobacterium sp.]|nr:hypothetical protein [Flavobacterium sp.]